MVIAPTALESFYPIFTENWAQDVSLTAAMMLTNNSISQIFTEHSECM